MLQVSFTIQNKHLLTWVIEVTSGKPLRMGAGCHWNQPRDKKVGTYSPTPQPLGKREGLEVKLIPKVQWFKQPWLCNEACIKKSLKYKLRELPGWRTCKSVAHPFPYTLPCAFLSSGCSWVVSSYNKPVI